MAAFELDVIRLETGCDLRCGMRIIFMPPSLGAGASILFILTHWQTFNA